MHQNPLHCTHGVLSSLDFWHLSNLPCPSLYVVTNERGRRLVGDLRGAQTTDQVVMVQTRQQRLLGQPVF
jgi:transcriptional regulator of met regulon